MIRHICKLVAIIALLGNTWLHAQSDTEKIPGEFFRIFESSPMEAFDFAFGTNKWMERNIDGIESVKAKYKDLIPLLGEYYGYEKIGDARIADGLIMNTYMVKYDRQPMRFDFILYRPKDEWQLQNLEFSDNWEEALEEIIGYHKSRN